MLRCAIVSFVLLAAHLTADWASAQAPRCRAGFVPSKTDQIKSLRNQGIAEIRGTSLFYEATLGAVDKTGRSFHLTVSSTKLEPLSRLVNALLPNRAPVLCARIDPTNYLARTQRLVPGGSLTARYNGYQLDIGRILPK